MPKTQPQVLFHRMDWQLNRRERKETAKKDVVEGNSTTFPPQYPANSGLHPASMV
jgi:hypothetical protein